MKYLIFTLLFYSSFVYSQKFKEVSNEVGLNFIYPGNDHQEIGAGITILDVNNDGWDDIFQAGGIFKSKLWLNKKGVFIDVSEKYNLALLDSMYILSAISADYDNDGFTDLFVTNVSNLNIRGDNRYPILLHNINGHHFEVVMQDAFITKGNFPSCAWGDINNDGFVDLFVLNYVRNMDNILDSLNNIISYNPSCLNNLFYINDRGLDFIDQSDAWGLNNSGCGLAACFTDFDNDNDVDLLMLNDFGSWNHLGNQLYRNDFPESKLTEISKEVGFYDEFYGMSIGPGDINNDGILDYYLTNIGKNRFFMNYIDSMKDLAMELNIDLTYAKDSLKSTSWSGLFFDVENDGDVDLFVSKGYLESFEKVIILDENKFLINNNGVFTDVTENSGINDKIVQRGAAYFDFDHDGDLDLVVGVIKMQRGDFGKVDQKIKLYRNENNTKNKWIGFHLIGSDGVNADCLGCSVTIENENGSKQIREVDGGSGHSSQSTKTLYFGLNKEKYAKNISIQWLGKETMNIPKLKAGHVYSITRNGKIKKVY